MSLTAEQERLNLYQPLLSNLISTTTSALAEPVLSVNDVRNKARTLSRTASMMYNLLDMINDDNQEEF